MRATARALVSSSHCDSNTVACAQSQPGGGGFGSCKRPHLADSPAVHLASHTAGSGRDNNMSAVFNVRPAACLANLRPFC